MSVLLEECLVALGDNSIVLPKEESDKVIKDFINNFPTTDWGRIDWNRFSVKSEHPDIQDIQASYLWDCYIIWSDAEMPVIKSNLDDVIKNIDDVSAVSFDTWLFSCNKKEVIEIFHDDIITYGSIINID